MVLTTIINNYLKEGCKAKYIKIAKKFAQDVLENDKGCQSFEIYEDKDNEDNVIMITKWENEKALHDHNTGTTFPKYKPEFRELFIKNEVQVYKLTI